MGLFDFRKKQEKTKKNTKNTNTTNNMEASNPLVRSDADVITSDEEAKLFTKTIGDKYVQEKQLELTEEEWNRMSITDGAEMWRLYSWLHSKVLPDDTEEKRSCSREKMDRLGAALASKILKAEELYCLYNKHTGEPHLFSNTVKQGEGYLCTPPDIRIFTKAYAGYQEKYYPEALFEMRKIENGADGKGIENFLGECFYLNGTQGVEINSGQVAISAEMLVAPPDFSGVQQISIPVMNPDLMRWMLLMAQFEEPETEDEKLIYRLYYRFMSQEIAKAKFLVPMKPGKDFPKGADGAGGITLKRGAEFMVATMKGKDDREALIMYTDWKRLRQRYDGWDGTIMTLEQMMDVYDAAVNPTEHPRLGFYIGKEMYADIIKYRENE